MSSSFRRQRLEEKLMAYRSRARWTKAAVPVLGAAIATLPVSHAAAQTCAGTLSNGICKVDINVTASPGSGKVNINLFNQEGESETYGEFYISILNSVGSVYFFTGFDGARGFHTEVVDNGSFSQPYIRPLNADVDVANLSFYEGSAFGSVRVFFLSYSGSGPWQDVVGQDRYAAVQLEVGGQQFHYGWIRLRYEGNRVFTIKDAAYNTALNASIETGEDGSGLPVELASFTARLDGESVLLNWTTLSETNNAGFEVQHRQRDDVGGWMPVRFVEGYGTTTEAHTYQHRLEGLEPGQHVFRLKQVDLDGTSVYSAQVEVTLELAQTYALGEAYPNPFNPQARFTLSVAETQQVRVSVYDLLGREVALLHAGVLAGDTAHEFVIDGGGLPSGTYLYRVQGERFVASRQVTLLK